MFSSDFSPQKIGVVTVNNLKLVKMITYPTRHMEIDWQLNPLSCVIDETKEFERRKKKLNHNIYARLHYFKYETVYNKT